MILGRFARRFETLYERLRDAGWDPAKAFDSASRKAAQEVGYRGWPLPSDWLEQAERVALSRDGQDLGNSRQFWAKSWREMHQGCIWCEKDQFSSDEPYLDGVMFTESLPYNQGAFERPVHASCMEDMRRRGVVH